ncbi:DUF488 domain-containing protein [Planococcus sp. ISL-110]|uniref:DUF488 domain-containing protein n=1 Tax=Planococcus sp. ISL-110 TaxID=2819167 RepID=UPI001BE61463|nr:DUF488 domain-containing protein [Planococcus sp. ISL-110]MBT2572040.1 DUF488 domain-containing protein [Planococcus sp. ISL-110]
MINGYLYNRPFRPFLGGFRRDAKKTGIKLLADVQAFPGSRKWPQFSKDRFPVWLEAEGIAYEHFPNLGGRRRKSKDIQEEKNAGWRNQSFHNLRITR